MSVTILLVNLYSVPDIHGMFGGLICRGYIGPIDVFFFNLCNISFLMDQLLADRLLGLVLFISIILVLTCCWRHVFYVVLPECLWSICYTELR